MLIPTKFLPSLSDAWISGFTDAEGTFYISIVHTGLTKTGYRINLRYMLDQKYAIELLTHIKNLFICGKVVVRKPDMYRYCCDSFVGVIPIISYFDTFPLKSKKAFTLQC